MKEIVHIIHSLTFGGAARTMIATAKYSAMLGPFRHSLIMLDLKNSDPRAAEFALREGMQLPVARNREEILAILEQADIVQVNWWQHPEMDEFLRSALPPIRLLGWFHCACDAAPQVLTDDLVSVFDRVLGGSSYTYFAPSIWRLPTEERLRKTGFVVGGTDFQRLENLPQAAARSSFDVGYVGTVNPTKMYGRFVEMHAGIKIPNFKAVVCGGDQHLILADRAAALGLTALFDFKGYVSNIPEILSALDVYGYPLCPETYAASELNVQEAMYAGIPVVAFPHGGLKTLIIDDFNGLLVTSEQEYREALEYLYQNPEERVRLGRNAASFAREMFGAERNAPEMNRHYESLLKEPKRIRTWPGYSAPGIPTQPVIGYQRFLESLGEFTSPFRETLAAQTLEDLIASEAKILHSTELMTQAGILNYNGAFSGDPLLSLWSGLALLGVGRGYDGAKYLFNAHSLGLPSFPERAFAYLAFLAAQEGDKDLESIALENLYSLSPDFPYEAVSALFASSLASRPSNLPL